MAPPTPRSASGSGTAAAPVDDTDPVANILTFDVTAVNDAPVNTLPASFSGTEDVTLNITGLSVSDVDDNGAAIMVTLSWRAGC